MTEINYITKIAITIMHETKSDTDGLEDVLMNVVSKWDLPLTPMVYQEKPEPVVGETKKFAEKWFC